MTAVEEAIDRLSNEEVVVIPTETVYGLAASAISEKAIAKIFEIKNRPQTNPLIVHISSIDDLERVAKNIPKSAYDLAHVFWPGPLTLILEKQPHISDLITSGKNTVAVRIPQHPIALNIISLFNYPIVAPSANKSNHISPTSAAHVLESLGDRTPFIVDGGTSTRGLESTIVGFASESAVIYRHGAISKEEIEAVLNEEVRFIDSDDQSISPGRSKKHYSPRTPLILTEDIFQSLKDYSSEKVGLLLFKKNEQLEKQYPTKVLSNLGNLTEASTNLYKFLYDLERQKLDLIIAEVCPDNGLGRSINDRLIRAASA
ncbi:L-threonylcarbamoyladenylate synthase [Parvicella tangerina]|uniref:Threonylcarbamoyl-AMP synthase n=1 Tax=Parvicella tangerina TaxID=2829795 RepID=A0A916NES6_9FLAO|nr:L-threonylcarbamoyladenylate synthase [Parvicella tangerina]CAG5087471.1 Threonylcarbamoyl-AMP synthase [Parvicella tangerina]